MDTAPGRRPLAMAALLVALLMAVTIVTTVALVRSDEKVVVPQSRGPLRIAVIGDSYTAGIDNDVVWPSLVANSSNLSISNVAVPGSGYVGGIGESGPFSAQTEKALATKPDVIVVFGGINDVGKSTDLITQSATDLLFELARRAPDASRIVLGPLWHQDPAPEAALTIDTAIAGAAEKTHSSYVRLIDKNWLVGQGLIQSDGIHPTDQGQSIMANELGPILRKKLNEQAAGG